jgi:hypothetical protein
MYTYTFVYTTYTTVHVYVCIIYGRCMLCTQALDWFVKTTSTTSHDGAIGLFTDDVMHICWELRGPHSHHIELCIEGSTYRIQVSQTANWTSRVLK